ncbi:mCG147200 [Mus musculus]|nr:mCG147200 [Mus musculus]
MRRAFFGKHHASTVGGQLLGLSPRVRRAGSLVRGWADCSLRMIWGAQNLLFPSPTNTPSW